MLTENFLIIGCRKMFSEKKNKDLYLLTLLSEEYRYTTDVFVSEDVYNKVVSLSTSELLGLARTLKALKIPNKRILIPLYLLAIVVPKEHINFVISNLS